MTMIKKSALKALLTVTFCLTSSMAVANNCPREMKAIDEALPAAKLSAAQLDEVKKLRADGEAQHKAGKHDESMASLNKAKSMLGIK
jgi:hypothetical protein